MSADFITSFPKWFILLCIAAGLLYAFILYYKNRIIDPEPGQKWISYLLFSLRFVAVTLISFLLLEPLLRYNKQEIEKPVLVFAIDNSESMTNSKDSGWIKGSMSDAFSQMEESLQDKYEIVNYSFGSSTKTGSDVDFTDKETDLSSLLHEIRNAYDGKILGGLVLATDGIYNKGSNPFYVSREIKAPVFSIALGDTTIKSDFFISSVRTNTIAYLGNSFPVLIDVTSRKCPSSPFEVQIIQNGAVVATEKAQIQGNPYSASFSFMLKATQKGTQAFQVRISRLSGEITYANNQKDFFIDVIDGRQKVLLLANAPHPDISAIKQSLEENENYEIALKNGEIPSPETCKKYDLVILHQWLTNASQKTFAESLKALKIPVLYVLGRQSNTAFFNQLAGNTAIKGINNSFNQSTPYLNESFSLFELSENTRTVINQFPPLTCPFGKYEVPQPDRSLFTQKIGVVNSKEAMWYLSDEEGYRTGFIAGEGFWRWRLHNFEKFKNHDVCKELITKTVQYLALKTDKRKFRVTPAQHSFNENEPLVFQAEVYNDNYEAINKQDVTLTMKDESGKSFPFTFSKTGENYKLNTGLMPPGKYSYLAKTMVSGVSQSISGNIYVKPLQLEKIESVANHKVLMQMAENTGGKVFNKDQTKNLTEMLLKQTTAKSVMHTEQTFKDLIHQKWLFFLFVLLLGIEWGVRKWMGAY